MTKILKDWADRTILFNEEQHEYFAGKVKLTPVTRFVGSFFPEFKREEIAEKYAMKHNLNVRDVLAEWDDAGRAASEKGKHIHSYAQSVIEKRDFEELYDKYSDIYAKINKAIERIRSKFEILGAEVIVTSLSLGLAGTIDLLCREQSDIVIFDWKSSKGIERENVWEAAYPPIEHLDNCNWNHYTLQLNTYERICKEEKYFPEATVFRKGIIDVESRTDPIFLKVEDFQKEVDHMVRWI